MQFSTYNESSLHHTLKILYSELYDGQTEVPLDGHIYDIVTNKGNIIEIQTKNLSKLYDKIEDTIKHHRNIKIVHPVPIIKTIETYDKNHKIISKRKSPVKGSIYDIFKELTKIYPYLLNKHFSLEIIEIDLIEERLKTDKPVQTKNKSRRFKKDWIKTDKKLEKIITTKIFNKKEDYLTLLPNTLPDEFSNKELKQALKEEKSVPARIYNNCNIITWVLLRMNLIEEIGKKSRSYYYKIKK